MPIQENRGARVARDRTFPAPIGGWNARDSLTKMPIQDAVRLENWFPRQTDVITRPGYASHCDTAEDGNSVKQLIPFEYAANTKLLGCVNGKIYDVTTSSASSLATGLSDDDWSYDYLGGVVQMANGADSPRQYDGSSITTPGWTGVTLANLNHVHSYKNRYYFVEKNTQAMWYGGVDAKTGALTTFDFSTVAPVRGNLCFTAHLKGDGGDGGNDDLFVAVFKDGDVLAYTGSDFGSNVNLIGHYRIGRPLSRLAYKQMADDVLVITNRGYEKLSQVVKYGVSAPQRALLSDRIQQAVTEDIQSIGESDDWRIAEYPRGQMLIVTVPRSGSARRYNVQNINTGRWCKFTDFVAYSWANLAGNIYFGGDDGIIYQFDNDAKSDNGATISCVAQQAWSHMGHPGREKLITLLKPYFFSENFPGVAINAAADFETLSQNDFVAESLMAGAIWDQAIWDTAIWTYGGSFDRWYTRNAIGKSIGIRVDVQVSAVDVVWNETLVLFNLGGYL